MKKLEALINKKKDTEEVSILDKYIDVQEQNFMNRFCESKKLTDDVLNKLVKKYLDPDLERVNDFKMSIVKLKAYFDDQSSILQVTLSNLMNVPF